MKPRIPLAYAGLLVIALVAVVGFAAFSPSTTGSADTTVATAGPADATVLASARVASAVLALRVSDSDARTATTEANDATTTTPTIAETAPDTSSLSTTSGADTTTTTAAPPSSTSAASTSTAPPADTTPPAITVTSPKDGATVTNRLVTFEGTTERGAHVSSGPYEADVSDDGTWSIRLIVVPGANGALFTATDRAGNSSNARIVVHYDAPTPTTQPATTTTTQGSTATTTAPPSTPEWSPNWPADPGGNQDVENWRSTVAKYFLPERVDCALGIIKRESHGNARAYNSYSSAEGLMQHLSKYWHSRAKSAGFVDGNGLVATPYNGEANIAAGAYLAKYYESATGNWWSPWKSSSGEFTAFYGSCQSTDPP